MSWTFPIQDKIIVITGGGSGIGLSSGILCQKGGAKAVLLADIALTDETKLAVKEYSQIEFVECDVTKWVDLQNLINLSLERFGGVPDVFIASAGVFEPPFSNFWEDPESLSEDGYKHVDINVNHPMGVVVLIGSIAGYSKQYAAPIYSATKHAVVGFTRSLGGAQELQGVKVVSVCPGIVTTPIWTTGTPGSGERFGINDAVAITAEDVAKTVLEAIQSAEYPGGAIIEVSRDGSRVIPEWHIDPPGMIDGEMAKGTTVPPDVIARALKPILDRTAAERGQAE